MVPFIWIVSRDLIKLYEKSEGIWMSRMQFLGREIGIVKDNSIEEYVPIYVEEISLVDGF